MKKVFILVIILFTAKAVSAQAFIITYLKGNVYHDHKLLKLHDRLDGVTHLTSSDKTAELALFSAQRGKFRLSFVNSKPISTNHAAKSSELYQLVVGNYLLTYTTEKMLTTRGDFDLKSFFNTADTGRNGHNVFLLEGELLPIKSQALNARPEDKFFIYTIKGKDTICSLIKRSSNFLIFDDQTINGITNIDDQNPRALSCFIRHGYTFNNKYTEDRFSGPVNITFLSRQYIQSLVSAFSEGMGSYYQGSKARLIADIESQLTFYYGHSFEPAVHQVLNSYLK